MRALTTAAARETSGFGRDGGSVEDSICLVCPRVVVESRLEELAFVPVVAFRVEWLEMRLMRVKSS